MVLPPARTAAEAHLYMDLHPCGCGESAFPRQSAVITAADGSLASRYTGICPGDGAEREFTFTLPEQLEPPSADGPVRYGGTHPSALIDPGEWLSVADAWARTVPAGSADGTDDPVAGRTLEQAAAAIDEVLKFIPADTEQVPATAFVTDRGRAVYASEPGRFRRLRLDVVRGTYRSIAARIRAATP